MCNDEVAVVPANAPQSAPSFTFCALRYLHTWYPREKEIHELLTQERCDTQSVLKALSYFQVSRSFTGLRKDNKSAVVRDAFIEAIRAPRENRVEQLATSFEEAGFSYNLSAASKLVWLWSPGSCKVYDKRARTALVRYYGLQGVDTGYAAFSTAWQNAYHAQQPVIRAAAQALLAPAVRAFMSPRVPPVDDLEQVVEEDFFLERIFDNYLWEIGGATD